MERLNIKSFVIAAALLFSISSNAEAAWKYIGTQNGGKLYVLLPIDYEAQYAYTIVWSKLPGPLDIRGWRYDARSIGSDVRIDCNVGSVKIRTIVAFSNSNLSGHRVSLAYIIQQNGVTIRPGSTISYNKLSSLQKRAVNYICE
ncbi:MAG: hypothetical protein ACRDGA_04640 [Bacteroidota bacterium]